jgi:hypothetical protein
MTLAMKRLKNFGWVALLSAICVLLYPLSLNVGALHSKLMETDRKIRDTKREISFLQAELRTRANMQQLADWNDLLYGYAPPTADQFLDGERALASLDGGEPQVKPVMVAVEGADGSAPAGVVGAVGAAASIKRDDTAAPVKIALAAEIKPQTAKPVIAGNSSGRTARVSKIDEELLSDRLLKEIDKQAAQERKRK